MSSLIPACKSNALPQNPHNPVSDGNTPSTMQAECERVNAVNNLFINYLVLDGVPVLPLSAWNIIIDYCNYSFEELLKLATTNEELLAIAEKFKGQKNTILILRDNIFIDTITLLQVIHKMPNIIEIDLTNCTNLTENEHIRPLYAAFAGLSLGKLSLTGTNIIARLQTERYSSDGYQYPALKQIMLSGATIELNEAGMLSHVLDQPVYYNDYRRADRTGILKAIETKNWTASCLAKLVGHAIDSPREYLFYFKSMLFSSHFSVNATINMDDNNGTYSSTLLHYVVLEGAESGATPVLELLLNNGIDVNRLDGRGRTALDLLSQNDSTWGSDDDLSYVERNLLYWSDPDAYATFPIDKRGSAGKKEEHRRLLLERRAQSSATLVGVNALANSVSSPKFAISDL